MASTSYYSADIHFQQLALNGSLAEKYYYVIQYEEDGMNFTGELLKIHDMTKTSVEATVKGLNPGTNYTVRVVPFRRDTENNLTESGQPTQEISFTTGLYIKCNSDIGYPC